MAIGYMATTLGETLIRYMPYLQPVLIAGLKNVAEYQVITSGPPLSQGSSFIADPRLICTHPHNRQLTVLY